MMKYNKGNASVLLCTACHRHILWEQMWVVSNTGIWEGKSLKLTLTFAVSTTLIFPKAIRQIFQAFCCFSAFCQIKIFVVFHGFEIKKYVYKVILSGFLLM